MPALHRMLMVGIAVACAGVVDVGVVDKREVVVEAGTLVVAAVVHVLVEVGIDLADSCDSVRLQLVELSVVEHVERELVLSSGVVGELASSRVELVVHVKLQLELDSNSSNHPPTTPSIMRPYYRLEQQRECCPSTTKIPYTPSYQI